MSTEAPPALEFAFEARVTIEAERHVGHGDGEELIFVPITGGVVAGPRLRGAVQAGGGDWMRRRGDVYALEARYLIQADDGALIDVVNRGFYRERPDRLYFRTSPVFRTDAPAHRWLAETVFVGLAEDHGSEIRIRFFAVA